MKIEVMVKKNVDIQKVLIDIPVRYDDEDIPYDFPLRAENTWSALIFIESGKIEGWPGGEGRLAMKVTDEGSYHLIDIDGETVSSIENNYIPNELIPGEYGDYIDLKINADGVITNWPKIPDVSEFFKSED